jgi:predicted phage tail protein
MHIIFFNGQDVERFNLEVKNLIQLYDYLKVNQPRIFKEVSTKELSYTIYLEGREKAYPLLATMLDYDFSGYDVLVICPKISGEVLFTSIAAAVTASVAASIGAGLAATAAGYVVATVVTVGIIIALGMLVRALSPQNKLDSQDPSQVSKLFNGVPNITEQGGSVPVVFGYCLYGGVRIGLKLEVAKTSYHDVTMVADFNAATGLPSKWLKLS